MDERSDELVELMTCEGEMQAALVQAVLEGEGVESWRVPSAVRPDGLFVGSGINPTTVRVRRSSVEAARAALERRREESVDLDWDSVDVGEPADRLAARIAERGHAPRRASMSSRAWAPLVWIVVTLFVIAAVKVGVEAIAWLGRRGP